MTLDSKLQTGNEKGVFTYEVPIREAKKDENHIFDTSLFSGIFIGDLGLYLGKLMTEEPASFPQYFLAGSIGALAGLAIGLCYEVTNSMRSES